MGTRLVHFLRFLKESLNPYIFPLFGSFQVQQWSFSKIGQYLGVLHRLKISVDTHYEAKNIFFARHLKIARLDVFGGENSWYGLKIKIRKYLTHLGPKKLSKYWDFPDFPIIF